LPPQALALVQEEPPTLGLCTVMASPHPDHHISITQLPHTGP
jgi:hypothetical protein